VLLDTGIMPGFNVGLCLVDFNEGGTFSGLTAEVFDSIRERELVDEPFLFSTTLVLFWAGS